MSDKQNTVNSEKYWDSRFREDWDSKSGDMQSRFFMQQAFNMFPEWLNDLLNKGGKKIMDWGCAEGDGTALFAKQFPKNDFIGIDFADSAVKTAIDRYASKNLKFEATDLLKPNNKNSNKYDIVFTSNVLEHFHEPWTVLEKISHFANDIIIMMVPFEEDPENLHFEHFTSFREDDFRITLSRFILVGFVVKDTAKEKDTSWNGKQALAIYVRNSSDIIKRLSVGDLVKYGRDAVVLEEVKHALEQKNIKLNKDIDTKELLIKELRGELDGVQQILSGLTGSRKYKTVSYATNLFYRGFRGVVRSKNLSIKMLRLFLREEPQGGVSDPDDQLKLASQIIESSGYFDPVYYLGENEDVRLAGFEPLRHFMEYGGVELRNPSEKFDSSFYVARNNLRDDGDSIDNPLLHYLQNSTPEQKALEEYSIKKRRAFEDGIIQEILDNKKGYKHAVIIESMAWSGSLQQRPHHLARLFAKKGVLVIYIDSGAYKSALIQEVEPNLYLIDDKKIIQDLSGVQIDHKYYWLFSTTPKSFDELLEMNKNGYELIYDYIDDFDEAISGDIQTQLSNFKQLDRLNPRILIASAKLLLSQLQQKFPNNKILLCPNAVDVRHFSYRRMQEKPDIPVDMQSVVLEGKKIVGYYGAMAPWLDYDLLNDITLDRPDLNFVFIGIDYNDGLKNLILRDNVHFLGAKNYFDLQDYSKLFDCAVIPFKRGDIAKSTSPVKLFEYMAMGIPTVCTQDLKECEGYNYVYMSSNRQEFMKNIDKAILDRVNNKAVRTLVKQAEANTWDARVDDIYNEMMGLMN